MRHLSAMSLSGLSALKSLRYIGGTHKLDRSLIRLEL
uniref:Uncharacterized protein n=1 Tax=Arundo donax TaxID=35708 RepID=A0A0A9G3H2_ARUDO